MFNGRDEAKMFSAVSHEHLMDFEKIFSDITDAAFVNATTLVGFTSNELVFWSLQNGKILLRVRKEAKNFLCCFFQR